MRLEHHLVGGYVRYISPHIIIIIIKLWQVRVKVVPVVVGALGTIPKALEKHLKEIGTYVRVELLQKAALLGRARDLCERTLEISCYEDVA